MLMNRWQRAPRSFAMGALLFAVILQAGSLRAQEELPAPSQAEQPAENSAPSAVSLPTASLHGIVKNAISGEPLARVLVQVAGDSGHAVLTDGEGRFEVHNVSLGPNPVQLLKPGYRDTAWPNAPTSLLLRSDAVSHNIFVTAEMPDVVLSMSPNNTLRGQIELSTGDPALDIEVQLFRRAIQDGRATWQRAQMTRTNSQGTFRFGSLPDGTYALCTLPAMDTEEASAGIEAGHEFAAQRSGYPAVFYPEAHDLSSASPIQLSGGQQVQANFNLKLEAFHPVRAEVIAPPGTGNLSTAILDADGHLLTYNASLEGHARAVQALLPDGSYSLRVTSASSVTSFDGSGPPHSMRIRTDGASTVSGQVDFTVAGHPLPNLRIPLSPRQTTPLQVNVVRTAAASAQLQPPSVYVTANHAGSDLGNDSGGQFASGQVPGPLSVSTLPPGAYWLHTVVSAPDLCESSFTAGGASLGHEPLIVGPTGTTAPLTLTLRDDCASLQLSLPASLAAPVAGEEIAYMVYVVPDFDYTSSIPPAVLRSSSGGSFTIHNLPPGSYHVYAFPGSVDLEWHNPEVLASLPGKTITLEPSASASLVVEVAAP